jgi:hypothetical protein
MADDRHDIAELFRIVNSKLDTVIATQAAVDSRLENLEKQAGETTRTLRGFNGTPGLVTQVAVLESTVKAVPCIKAGHPPCEDNAKPAHLPAPNSQGDGGRGASSTYISWQWAAEKLIVPVMVTFVAWFLFTILPQWFQHLSNVP